MYIQHIRARTTATLLVGSVSFLALNEWLHLELLGDREGTETLLRLTEEPFVQVQVNVDPDGEDWQPGPSIEECRARMAKFDGDDDGIDRQIIAGIYALADIHVKAIKAGVVPAPTLEDIRDELQRAQTCIDRGPEPGDDDRLLETGVDTQADGTLIVNTKLPTAERTLERDASEIDPQAKTTRNASDPGKVAEEFTPPPSPVVPAIPSSTSATVLEGDPEPATVTVQEAAVPAKTETKPAAKATPKPKH